MPSRGCLFEQRKAPADTLGGILRSLIGRAEGRSHQEPKGTAADRSPSPRLLPEFVQANSSAKAP